MCVCVEGRGQGDKRSHKSGSEEMMQIVGDTASMGMSYVVDRTTCCSDLSDTDSGFFPFSASAKSI